MPPRKPLSSVAQPPRKGSARSVTQVAPTPPTAAPAVVKALPSQGRENNDQQIPFRVKPSQYAEFKRLHQEYNAATGDGFDLATFFREVVWEPALRDLAKLYPARY